jgi:hypothetical protein
MTRVLFTGGFVPIRHDELEPCPPMPPLGNARVVLMAFHGGADVPPFAPVRAAGSGKACGARVVRGEILRDPPGRLYELCGRELRPLHRVVQGPRGEILEIQPPRPRTAPRTPATDLDIVDAEEVDERPASPTDDRAVGAVGATSGAATHRKLFADPGAKCAVSLGDFRGLLTPQIAQPERLRDSHRLACHIQVYEATVAQRFDALVMAVRADAGPAAEVRPLTEEAVQRLGVVELRRLRGSGPRARRRPGGVLALDRVFCLRVASDPTVATPGPPPTAPLSARPHDVAGYRPGVRQTSIPERFLAPWEFPLSREEVLYEMDVESLSGGLRNALSRVWGSLTRRGDLEKWRARLPGKPLEEQLWAIRPPKGLLGHSAIRQWAREHLEAAGYEPGPMVREWEIYWRRKGV